MKQDIENIIKKKHNELFKIDFNLDYNTKLNLQRAILDSLADEVLKVVVEKIEMLYGDIVTTKKDIAIPHNCIEYETALDDVVNLLSNLSPNKENK